MDSGRRGFTLIEMITVMAIATLITIASAPAFMNFARTQRIRGAASEIASALNSARRYAITHNTDYAVYIYSNAYSGADIRNSFLFNETEEMVERRLLHRVVDILDDQTTGPQLPGGEYEFEFTPRGSLSGVNRTIKLEDPSGQGIEIKVFNTTGRVSVGELK